MVGMSVPNRGYFSIVYKNTPLYNFFHKKEIVQGFLMYNEFDQNITKESDPVRQTHYTTKIH